MKRLTFFIVLASIIVLSGCAVQQNQITNSPKPEETPKVSVSPTVTPETEQTPLPTDEITPAPTSEPVKYVLTSIFNNMVLVPELGDDLYKMFEEGEKYIFWTVSDYDYKIAPAELKVEKIGEVTGKKSFDTVEMTYDVYKISLDDVVFYDTSRNPIDEKYLLRTFYGLIQGGKYSGNDLSNQQTTDYTVMLIFGDLYTIDKNDQISMLSSRNIEGYDYETIDKTGIPDIIPWVWIDQPYCMSWNFVYYLTSREGNFYNIWYIDIDKGVEGKLTEDIAYKLLGTNELELLYSIITESGEAQLFISEIGNEAKVFRKDIKDIWFLNKALGYTENEFSIIDFGTLEIVLDGRYQKIRPFYRPFYDHSDIWLASNYRYGEAGTFIRIVLMDSITIFNDVKAAPISQWFDMFRNIDENRIPLFKELENGDIVQTEISEYGIGITTMVRGEITTWE